MMRTFHALAFVALSLVVSTATAQAPQVIPGDLLVMLRSDGSAQKVAEDLAVFNGTANGLHVEREVSASMRAWLLRFDPQRADQAVLLRAVRNHPHVQLAQNNHHLTLREVPNDERFGDQWHHQNINSEAAWDISTGGLTADGDTIVVCIIENCNLPHDDLIANAWINHQEIPDNGVDDDANGYTDDYLGWSPNNDDDEVYGGSHGTQVAGMIGATGDNEVGVVGANWTVKMMVVSNSGASDAGVIASHSYPLTMRRMYNETNGEKGAFVVATNASWGIDGGQPEDSPLWCAMYDSLGVQGILNCGATANNSVDVDVVGDLPTACPSDFMISVTATDIDDERTFSAYGLTTIDVGAPGAAVLTTNISGGYGTTSGTSFASPLTAGVIGLLYSAPCSGMMTLVKGDPQAGALFIREKLFAGVDQVGDLPGNTVTGGRINAGTSMELIMATCGACPAPYNVFVQAVDITSAMISWQSIAGSLFDLRFREVGATAWTDVLGVSGTSYLIEDLMGCTAYEFQILAHCQEENSDHSNPYMWTSEGCCTAPAGLTQVAADENSTDLAWNGVLAAQSFDVRYAVVGDPTFTEINGITDPLLTIEGLASCTNYTVQVRTICDGIATSWSTAVTVNIPGCGACTDLAYCPTEGGDSSGEWIEQVQLASIDHTSGNDNGYGDHTTNSTELMVGVPIAMTLTPGFSTFSFTEWYKVWVDLDQDGELDETERVFTSESGSSDPVNGTITIPWAATLGYTRLRVSMHYNTLPANACLPSFNYGEVEDYCVNIIANPNVAISERPSFGEVVYPQPADERLFVRTETSLRAIHIFDGTGRLLGQEQVQTTPVVIHTADLADGMYTYRLIGTDGSIGQGRFMVTHLR
ncbi:MAG: S8 family serine peptidase [Flavobacteriales bacterium]|nr:S8 family serine peptidase [Flavobacteriales bacterium]